MSESAGNSKQNSFIDDIFSKRPDEEPVASPPAPPSSRQGNEHGRGGDDAGTVEGQQLALPLETGQDARTRQNHHGRGGRKPPRGFVPVTHDPDVARSYSDNASMDQAIAHGLAQVIAAMSPEELAALKAKVARAAARDGRDGTSKGSR